MVIICMNFVSNGECAHQCLFLILCSLQQLLSTVPESSGNNSIRVNTLTRLGMAHDIKILFTFHIFVIMYSGYGSISCLTILILLRYFLTAIYRWSKSADEEEQRSCEAIPGGTEARSWQQAGYIRAESCTEQNSKRTIVLIY